MSISSTTQPPYEVILDLVQHNWAIFVDDTERCGFFVAGRPRLGEDEIPSMFSFPRYNNVSQRTIPENKTTLEEFTFEIRYYTYNNDVLFNVQQALKQIIISDNKVQTTEQLIASGIEWIKVEKFEYNYILTETEHIMYELAVTITCAYQEDYN